jgi:ferric iron reductase protein FhuF
VPATALAAADGPLAALLAVDRTGQMVQDRRVLASSFFQGLAVRVLGVAAGVWLMTGRLPDVRAERTSIRLQFGLPAAISFEAPTTRSTDEGDLFGWFAEAAFPGHLEPVAARLKAILPLGARMLWGNAAAALVHAGLSVEQAGAASGGRSVDRLVAALPHRLSAMGAVDLARVDDAGSAFWSRTNCCLWFLEDPAREVCNSCSLLPPDERRRRVAAAAAPA